MSRDLLAILERMDQRSLEVQLAIQCAPVLTGMKVGNLLIMEKADAYGLSDLLEGGQVRHWLLSPAEERQVYLIYNRGKLKTYMETREVSVLLRLLGYQNKEFYKALEEVSRRYKRYREGCREFPHELGLFLGYPAEDVIGFIDYRGRGFLYIGYWKVYGNPEEAKILFAAYDRAREKAVNAVFQGNSIKSIFDRAE